MSTAAFGVGLFGVGMFLLVRTGIFKSWLILKTLPGLMSARMFYAAFPIGLGFLLLSFLPLHPYYDLNRQPFTTLVLLFTWGGPLLGFWFMYRPPGWLQPKWVLWLEQEYGYCLFILIEEAQKMNRWVWESRVRTQTGLQVWIDEVFAHRQEDVDWLWQIEKSNLVIQQQVRREKYVIKAGMSIEGPVPSHRRNDITLSKEEMEKVTHAKNAPFVRKWQEKKETDESIHDSNS
jgi:hypothetical protein